MAQVQGSQGTQLASTPSPETQALAGEVWQESLEEKGSGRRELG